MGRISLVRVQEYLDRQEVTPRGIQGISQDGPMIDIESAQLKWQKEGEFQVSIESLQLQKQSINLVLGGVGTGKTLFIKSLLGESVTTSQRFSVPGQIAYVSEHTWLMNESVRNNILMGSEEDREKLSACLKVTELSGEVTLD